MAKKSKRNKIIKETVVRLPHVKNSERSKFRLGNLFSNHFKKQHEKSLARLIKCRWGHMLKFFEKILKMMKSTLLELYFYTNLIFLKLKKRTLLYWKRWPGKKISPFLKLFSNKISTLRHQRYWGWKKDLISDTQCSEGKLSINSAIPKR